MTEQKILRIRSRGPSHTHEGPRAAQDHSHAAIAVNARERAAVGPELLAFVKALQSEGARAEYQPLLDCIDKGSVDSEALVAKLESFLEVVLMTGRVRQRLGLHAEDSIRRLFAKTPRGAALEASAGEVTKALASLKGQTIDEIAVSLVRPGTYRMILETEQHRISLGFAPAGAHVESVEVTI
jgi:hypothetical protein